MRISVFECTSVGGSVCVYTCICTRKYLRMYVYVCMSSQNNFVLTSSLPSSIPASVEDWL